MTFTEGTNGMSDAPVRVLALDHTAIAVRSFEPALRLYRDLLGGTLVDEGVGRNGEFRWLQLQYPNGSKIELICPGNGPSFLTEFLDRRGEGLHHLTFLVEDVRAAVGAAAARGYRVVGQNYDDPTWQEAFISPRSACGTVVQLAQTSA